MPIFWTDRFAPYALAALRVFAGLLFFGHGLIKLFGFPGGASPGAQSLTSLLGAGAVIETVGGALIILGLFTRPTAFILAGEMAVAYFLFHAPKNFFPSLNGGEEAILFTFIFLYLSTSGPGALSLDGARIQNRR
ncbi:DoxX family protein [Beijerinckia sp. L45]|uniref:DoxX family protein n=1 Tax=Beijerinckia sp. L45 TaxID=1641855 RepID=UPI00131D6706|nr:DoxX family protein [Beijerinckia sp. L45]